ncbi:MAG: potassium/proton antiporter [Euryhalocaulis sp.]|uniref:potassium/proton antiporter n=1 Tax=Euryhalocaulis sp. TaxID=2744307 RepID=UPI00179AE34F|nr:potassium/proton antiporter [Euryhalocaulis sp.]MBA4802911.1 potassium/proton antiporter [Euryhalocaulis sp.]
MDSAAYILLLGSGLVVLAIAAAAATGRIGAPILLVFLALGMLAGEEGPGGIAFENYELAYLFGGLALAIILFDGGARTSRRIFRLAAKPAGALATVGVALTAGLTGAFAAWLFGFGWVEAGLLGAIVASTDAAAVFSLLGGRGLRVAPRVAATLEAESGLNDPIAVFLVLAFVSVLTGTAPDTWYGWVLSVSWQAAGGAVIGMASGWLILAAQKRLNMARGLYPIFALAGGIAAFGFAQSLSASGFLAVYLAGVVYGNGDRREADAVASALDGFAWLAQIGMFLMLGMLVFPSHLIAVAPGALAIAAFLILVARPLAVFLSLIPFRFLPRERAFVSWTGLRGAVPIFLGVIPVLAGVENANLYFSIAFAVVLVSLLVQGWTIPLAARLTGVIEDRPGSEERRHRAVWRSPRTWAGLAAASAAMVSTVWIARVAEPTGPVTIAPATVDELRAALSADSPGGAELVADFPPDFDQIEDVDTRKRLFLQTLEPLIRAGNAQVLDDRAAIENWMSAELEGRRLTLSEQAHRDLLARRYNTPYSDLEEMLRRADVIPPSLAMAQAVLATGWGTSDAVLQRNALFGRRPDTPETGEERPLQFETLYDSVWDYMRALNSRPEYSALREARESVRSSNVYPRGDAMARYIGPYAQSGEAYVAQVQAVIESNELTRFDQPAESSEESPPSLDSPRL